MPSVGERLRHAREQRETTIEEVAAATGIGLSYLQAMEEDAFEALPGRAFGKLYLRAYGEVLGFDPQPLIHHYDQERPRDVDVQPERRLLSDEPRRVEAAIAKWRAERIASHGGREVVDEPDTTPSPPETYGVITPAAETVPPVASETVADAPDLPTISSPELTEVIETTVVAAAPKAPVVNKLAATVVGGVVVVAAIAGIVFWLRDTPAPPAPPPAAPLEAEAPPAAEPPPTVVAPPAPKPAPAKPRPAATLPPSDLTIDEYATGRRLVDRAVAAPESRFTEGDVVWFATRVAGGRSGERIRHVWLHEGRAVQSIRLTLGAADWRTYSSKTLWGAGAWVVEARDDSGKVLARSAFTCARR